MMAGEQTRRIPGRPGINGLRVVSWVEVPEEDLETVRRIARATNINAESDIVRKEGYLPALSDNEVELGSLKFKVGDTPRHVVKADPRDVSRIDRAIYEAKLQADYIIVTVHSHQLSGSEKENPADFLKEFSRHCIDVGANAVIGHGPHLLRPIEIYKDSPIFYSLGDFALQLYDIEFAPEEFYEKYGLSSSDTVHELLRKRSKDFTVGLMTDARMFKTVIPYWETRDKKITKLELMPVELAMHGSKSQIGLPRKSDNPEIWEYLAHMCRPYGTEITPGSDGLLCCRW